MVQILQLRLKGKILGRHTGVSPETYLEHRFNEVRSDFPSFYSFINPFIMRTSNGQTACLNGNHTESVNGSEILKPLNSVEQEFIGNLKFQGIEELVSSLKMIHDFALYHTDLCFDTEEKTALFNLKILWEGLDRLGKP